jgi:hypothetical protein
VDASSYHRVACVVPVPCVLGFLPTFLNECIIGDGTANLCRLSGLILLIAAIPGGGRPEEPLEMLLDGFRRFWRGAEDKIQANALIQSVLRLKMRIDPRKRRSIQESVAGASIGKIKVVSACTEVDGRVRGNAGFPNRANWKAPWR